MTGAAPQTAIVSSVFRMPSDSSFLPNIGNGQTATGGSMLITGASLAGELRVGQVVTLEG
jgi:hypothetical protein